ncbi:MAG: DUF1015 domain-containing protein [Actinobacteria bacterium]|nr:DUF1015 domain-containing protein [Actinomycetota bacterium]
MTRLGGIPLRLVADDWGTDVPSPPHDALTPAQRRSFLSTHPNSYLAVTRGPEDVDPGVSLTPEQLLNEGRVALDRLFDKGAFQPLRPEAFYAYRLEDEAHSQTGIICGVPADGLRTGELRAHESVHGTRRDHLAKHLEVVGYQSSPVVVSHRADAAVARVLATATERDPLLHHEGDDDLNQTIWVMTSHEADTVIEALKDDPLYVIDGHHRTGAAQTYFDDNDGEGPSRWLLAAIFLSDEMRNLAHHRIWFGDTPAGITLLEEVLESMGARPIEGNIGVALFDRADDEIAVHAGDNWYIVSLPIDFDAPVVAQLESSRLEEQLLPLLSGIVAYRPGSSPIGELADEAGESEGALFMLRPVTMDQLFEVADAGQTMPAKTTYFAPKARSGLFVRPMV